MPCRNIGPCHALPAWMREPNHADIDGLFCRRGNRDRGGRAGLGGGYLAANITSPPVQASVQAGTQDVGGADNRLDGASGAGAAVWLRDETRCRARPRAAAATAANATTAPAANTGGSALRQCSSCRREVRQQRSGRCNPYSPAATSENPSNRPTKRPPRRRKPSRGRVMPTSSGRTAEKRRAERRQRWADKRRVQQPREQELEAVEERVREVTEPRRIRIRDSQGEHRMFGAQRGANRNAPDQAVRSGLIDFFPTIRDCILERDDFLDNVIPLQRSVCARSSASPAFVPRESR